MPGAEPPQAVGRKTADGFQVFVADGLDPDGRSGVVAKLGLED